MPTAPLERDEPRADPQAIAQRAWCLYDWASSAFATSIIAAILPVFFAEVAGRSMAGNLATARWGYASAAAMLVSTVIGPLVGALADRTGRRKHLLFVCVLVGAGATAMLALAPPGDWRALLLLFGVAFIGFAVGNVLYDALLPAVARPEDLHRVSTRGYAYGYVGGGLLLALHLGWIVAPRRFGLPDADAAVRLAFASVAVWWIAFSIPLFRGLRETRLEPVTSGVSTRVTDAFRQVGRTIRTLRGRPELLRFLIAFWLYSDGIGTVIKMATVYGTEVGIDRTALIGALLMVQIVAAPATVVFGHLAARIGPQRAVALGLLGYVVITALGFVMSRPWHFWAIAALVALFQGGTQALSRSMYASLVPPRQLAEMFGFYSMGEKLAGVVGPLLFGAVAQVSGTGRLAVLTLLPFFLGGIWALMSVDLASGRRRALA